MLQQLKCVHEESNACVTVSVSKNVYMQLVTNLGIGGKVTVGSGAGTERSVHSFFDSEGWKSGRRKL